MELSVDSVEEWRSFTPKSGRFTIELPAILQHASEMVPITGSNEFIRYTMYVGQSKRGTTFMINVIDYPEKFDTSNTEQLLNNVVKEMVAGKESNRVEDEVRDFFLGFPSADFVVSNHVGFMHVRAFLCDHSLFVLSVADSDKTETNKAFESFVNSFSLSAKQ